MKRIAAIMLALLVAVCFTACDNEEDDYDYQLYKATVGLDEAVGGYDEDEDRPRNWEYERRMVEERVDEAIENQANLY